MDIRGRDPATECYRIVVNVDGRDVMGLVPERLAADLRLVGARPTHQDAYVWIAAHKDRIEAAIEALASGSKPPKRPFDQITLSEDF
ncbi:MAG: hypothetical protein AAGP08_12260 [Pseudomonadota bacterium]